MAVRPRHAAPTAKRKCLREARMRLPYSAARVSTVRHCAVPGGYLRVTRARVLTTAVPSRHVNPAHAPRRSTLLDPREAAEARAAVDALVERGESWRPPPREPDDGPPAPDELLIVLRAKRKADTRRLYARELALFFAFRAGRDQAAHRVRAAGRATAGLGAGSAATASRCAPRPGA